MDSEAKKSTEQKIDELLGIPSDKSFDDYLSDLDIDQVEATISSANAVVDEEVKAAVDRIDTQISAFNVTGGNVEAVDMLQIDESLAEIKSLVKQSTSILKHVHDCVITSDLLDSEAIDSFSHLLEASHLTIAEYVNLYKSRVAFRDKIRMMMLKHQHDLELLAVKHQNDLDLLKARGEQKVLDAKTDEDADKIAATFEQMVKAISFDDDISPTVQVNTQTDEEGNN